MDPEQAVRGVQGYSGILIRIICIINTYICIINTYICYLLYKYTYLLYILYVLKYHYTPVPPSPHFTSFLCCQEEILSAVWSGDVDVDMISGASPEPVCVGGGHPLPTPHSGENIFLTTVRGVQGQGPLGLSTAGSADRTGVDRPNGRCSKCDRSVCRSTTRPSRHHARR